MRAAQCCRCTLLGGSSGGGGKGDDDAWGRRRPTPRSLARRSVPRWRPRGRGHVVVTPVLLRLLLRLVRDDNSGGFARSAGAAAASAEARYNWWGVGEAAMRCIYWLTQQRRSQRLERLPLLPTQLEAVARAPRLSQRCRRTKGPLCPLLCGTLTRKRAARCRRPSPPRPQLLRIARAGGPTSATRAKGCQYNESGGFFSRSWPVVPRRLAAAAACARAAPRLVKAQQRRPSSQAPWWGGSHALSSLHLDCASVRLARHCGQA